MAAESNTPVDIEIWIEKVIKSCEKFSHYVCARKLIKLYIKRLQDEGMPYYQCKSIRDKFEGILWSLEDGRDGMEFDDENWKDILQKTNKNEK
jgi:hypothetical protein